MVETVHILNPAAGAGRAAQLCHVQEGDLIYETKGEGDAERYVCELCRQNPYAHMIIYGGDGTVNEAVNGIMAAGAGKTARFSAVAAGTGNDFIRAFEGKEGEFPIDLIRCNGRYAADMLNIGFDCDVVAKTMSLKKLPLVSGSFAYILGVASVLCGKMGHHRRITMTGADGNEEIFDDDFLLTVAANAPYCGGGFQAASPARTDDGLLDLMMVKKVSRRRFIALIKDYHDGTHMDTKSCQPTEKFRDIITYRRFTKAKIEDISLLCADGEVTAAKEAVIEVVPRAAVYVTIDALHAAGEMAAASV